MEYYTPLGLTRGEGTPAIYVVAQLHFPSDYNTLLTIYVSGVVRLWIKNILLFTVLPLDFEFVTFSERFQRKNVKLFPYSALRASVAPPALSCRYSMKVFEIKVLIFSM